MSGTPSSDPVTAGNHGSWITIIAAMLLTWMLCVYLTRVFIRLRFTPWGWDDNVITFGTLVAIAQVATVCESVHYGLGKAGSLLTAGDLNMVEITLYCSQILYIVALGSSKCGTAVLIMRLTRTRSHQLATNVVIAITTVWAIASIFVVALRGDLHHPWTAWDQPGSGLFARWIAIEVIGILIEFAIVGLSITLVLFLQMKTSLKVMVVSAFFTRILVVIPAILRLYYIRPFYTAPDPTLDNDYAVILTQVAMHYGLIAASIPCLKPFIRPFDTGFIGDTGDGYANMSNHNGMWPVKTRSSSVGSNMALNSVNSNISRNSGKTRGKGKDGDAEKDALGTNSNKRSGRLESWTSRGVRVHTPAGHSLRPDVGEMITVVEHSPHVHRNDEQQNSMNDGDMVIRQTKEYEVHFEKADEFV